MTQHLVSEITSTLLSIVGIQGWGERETMRGCGSQHNSCLTFNSDQLIGVFRLGPLEVTFDNWLNEQCHI